MRGYPLPQPSSFMEVPQIKYVIRSHHLCFQNYTFETPSGETAVLLEFDVVGRDEVDSVARIPVLIAHERRGTVLMGWIQFTELTYVAYQLKYRARALGCVNFVSAFAFHINLALPAPITQPGGHLFSRALFIMINKYRLKERYYVPR